MSRAGKRLAGVVLGCCLAAAGSGCSFHRTAHGFVLRSGQWTLERNREAPDVSAKELPDKPEELPWRSRLKGYRLARIFHERESASEAFAPSKAAGQLQSRESAPLPEPERPDLVVE